MTVELALQTLRHARNNMTKVDFLAEVHRLTEDADVAWPLMQAGTQVCSARIKYNAKMKDKE